MGDRFRPVFIEELPSHLILEILSSGRLSAADLVCLELTSKTFGGSHGFFPCKFRSLVDSAAFQLCTSHLIYSGMNLNAQRELYERCGGNWKRVLRFLQSVEQSSEMVATSSGNVIFVYVNRWIYLHLGIEHLKIKYSSILWIMIKCYSNSILATMVYNTLLELMVVIFCFSPVWRKFLEPGIFSPCSAISSCFKAKLLYIV